MGVFLRRYLSVCERGVQGQKSRILSLQVGFYDMKKGYRRILANRHCTLFVMNNSLPVQPHIVSIW